MNFMRLGKRKTSLRTLIITGSALILLLIIAFEFFVILPRQQSIVVQSLRLSSEQTLEQLAASILSPLLKREFALVYESIDSLVDTNETWKSIQVVDKNGQQIYPLGEFVESDLPGDFIIEKELGSELDQQGQIRLLINLDAAVAESTKLTTLLAYFQVAIGVLFVLVVVMLIERLIRRPLTQLGWALSRLSKGDYESDAQDVKIKEVSTVIEQFRDTRDAIRQYQEDQRLLIQAAESANRAKTSFLSRMSHELRTPLNSILGFSEILMSGNNSELEEREELSAIHRSGLHLIGLIDDILDYVSLEAKTPEFELRPVDTMDVIEDCKSVSSSYTSRDDISVEFLPVAPQSIIVCADTRRLIQAITNLISNAVKYNQSGGKVEVGVEKRGGDFAWIYVKDSGIGLSAEEQQRIFTPFERLKRHEDVVDGMGIGLALTKELVEAMGGRIGVDSVLNQGATFWIELPLVNKRVIPYGVKAMETESDGISPVLVSDYVANLKVLVAEDNPMNQKLIESQLNKLGCVCDIVVNGIMALKAVSGKQYDVLLTDIMMPEMDGLELTRQIRAQELHSGKHMIIIATSASVTEEDQQAGADAGVDDYLIKPVSLITLKDALELAAERLH